MIYEVAPGAAYYMMAHGAAYMKEFHRLHNEEERQIMLIRGFATWLKLMRVVT